MKTITPAMRAHLDGAVTTLCSILTVTRTDGVVVRLTEHDRDVVVSGQTYLANAGYRRSGSRSAANLSVPSMDVLGALSDGAIARADVEAGLYDYAEVRLSIVNWADTTMGEIKMLRGTFGEVSVSEKGTFRAELRGFAQTLDQEILTKYQPECRADFGDAACGYPVYPPVLGREEEVAVGEHYRVPTGSASGLAWPNLAPNPGFEMDAEGDDVQEVTGWEIVSGKWDLVTTREGLGPHGGVLYLSGSTSSGVLRASVDLDDAGVDTAHVDAGDVTADLSVWRANAAIDDTGRVLLEALDADGANLSDLYDSGDEEITPQNEWKERGDTGMVLPSGTRALRITLTATRVTLPYASVGFDDLSLALADAAGTNVYQEIYENRVYEVATAGTTAAAQPTYDTTPGYDTTDGTAVLTCEDSAARHAWVQTVLSARAFTVELGEDPPADGWFARGEAFFETGPLAGVSGEVKAWDQGTGLLTLYLALPFAPSPGERLRLHRGCDKHFDTCIDDFDNVLNFRGDPFVPGEDTLAFRPTEGSNPSYRTVPLRRPAP